MYAPRLRGLVWVVAAAALCTASCKDAHAPRSAQRPPPAEFLLSSEDSTFWVVAGSGETRVRGAPLTLTRYDGRFYELYQADDDRSYDDALLVGERLYRRDIATGDSAQVFTDTVVARVADQYARAHPDERPLGPDDEGDANPSTSVTAEIDVLNALGPFVSYEYHVDMTIPGHAPWHSTRRGVIDLRSGQPVTLADVFGAAEASKLIARGRAGFQTTRDSIERSRAAMSETDRRAAEALAHLEFDERSFSIDNVDGDPAVTFGIPGHGSGAAGNVVELEPLTIDSVSWWKDIRPLLPHTDSSDDDRWDHGTYHVVARYDTSGDIARVSIGDSTNREWPLVTVDAPLERIDWLDRPAVSDITRKQLKRAFDEAASYGESSRVAIRSGDTTSVPSILHFAAHDRFPRPHANVQARPRKPARNVRAHDARACEQHGARVRRCDSLDDGQDRRDRRIPAQPGSRGHRVDRSSRLPRAHSPGRSRGHEGERQLRRTLVDGGGCAGRSGRAADRPAPSHQLVLSDVRCR